MESNTTRRGRPGQFTDEQVLEMRTAWANGRRVKDLSDDYCVSEPTISMIVHGKSYKHVPMVRKVAKPRSKDFRYPYTYASDFMLTLAPSLTGQEAAQLRHGIAYALGLEDSELARALADVELDKQVSAPRPRSWRYKIVRALRIAL